MQTCGAGHRVGNASFWLQQQVLKGANLGLNPTSVKVRFLIGGLKITCGAEHHNPKKNLAWVNLLMIANEWQISDKQSSKMFHYIIEFMECP